MVNSLHNPAPSFIGRLRASASVLLAAGLFAVSGCVQAQAQQPANPPGFVPMPAPGSNPAALTRYERRQGGTGEVFRRDPNIWVYTPEIARQVDMPMQWASSELKGVVAAAFRVEPEGAEMDCGFGGNRNACKPVVNCITELYFDRNAPQPPWNMKMQAGDFNPFFGSSIAHSELWGADQQRRPGRRPNMISGAVFTDPETGASLAWRFVSALGGGYREIAYDREIGGSLAYLKVVGPCSATPPEPNQPLVVQLVRQNARFQVEKVWYEVSLPYEWSVRTFAESQRAARAEEGFFRGTWQNMQRGGSIAPNPARGAQP